MHRKRAEDFGRFWKTQLVEMRPASGEDGWFSLAETFVAGATRVGWGKWKSQNRKITPLSPYVEKHLNSKVIKSFVPEQRSRQVFFVFRDSYVLSLWTFDVHFTQSHIMAMVHCVLSCPGSGIGKYICLQIIYILNMYEYSGFGVKLPKMVDMP